MEKGFDIEAQKEELRQINNQLALLMAKKRAIQKYLKKEANNEENIRQRIIELRNDKAFYKENGAELGQFDLIITREDTYLEVDKNGKKEYCPLDAIGEEIE